MYEDEDLQEIHEDIIELNEDISVLRKDLNNISASVEGSGENVTLNGTAEARFKKPPLPIGNSEQIDNLLPEGYVQLDYIQSSGTEYIDIGDTLNNVDLEIKFQSLNESDREQIILGGRDYAGAIDANKDFTIWLHKENDKIGIHNMGADTTYHYSGDFTNPSILRLEIQDLQNNVYFNDNLLFTFSGIGLNNCEKSAFIFAGRTDNYKDSRSFTGKIFHLKVWKNNSLIKEFIPCKNPSNQIGMFDLVNKTFYSNMGTGSFIAGNEVSIPNPDYPQEIENVTGDVEVKVQNKNLFDGSLFSSLTRNEDGTYKTNTAYTAADYVPMRLKPNTQYVISLRDVNYNLIGGDFGIYVDDTYIGSTNNMYKFTSSSTKITNIKIAASGWSTVGTVNRFIQLEENSTATTYTPHKEQTYTFPLGNEKLMLGDYLADDGIHKNRKKIVLDGTSENKFSSFSTGANNRGVITAFSDIKKGVDFRYNTALCTNFAYVPNVYFDSGDTEGFIVDSTGTIYVRFGSQSEINTLAKANQWLANTLPELEYELAEETIIPYTPAQQEVYNQIKQALSYDEQTNVSSNTIALFTVKAFKNMNTSIESLQSRIELLKGRS